MSAFIYSGPTNPLLMHQPLFDVSAIYSIIYQVQQSGTPIYPTLQGSFSIKLFQALLVDRKFSALI